MIVMNRKTSDMEYFKDYKQLTFEELKQRYHELSKKHHPDITTGNDLEMAAINKEYAIARKWYEKRQKQKQARAKIISKVSDKTLKGIEALQPIYEPELKELAINKGKLLINKKIPKQYRDVAGLFLEKLVGESDILDVAKRGIEQLKRHADKYLT